MSRWQESIEWGFTEFSVIVVIRLKGPRKDGIITIKVQGVFCKGFYPPYLVMKDFMWDSLSDSM